MNQGIYGFPSTTGIALPNIISITEFDANASYTIPPTAASLQILLIGGAGGGGGGAGGNGTNASGGGAGSGGSIIYVDCLVVDDLPSTTLNVTIGAGGAGGGSGTNTRSATNGGPGGNSSISMSGFPGLFIRAQGGGGGATSGAAPSAAGVAAGGAGKISNFGFVSVTNSSGQNGGSSNIPMSTIGCIIFDARNNNGAGGGSSVSGTIATTGGSIEIATNATVTSSPILYHLNLPLVGAAFGITAALGGQINAGPTLGAGQNGTFMIGTSLKLLGGGIGGAGGGASNSATVTLGGGNGGNGFRGGGGGGGGAARVATVPGGTGGNGGNGYCCIVAKA